MCEIIECGNFALATNEALTQLLKLICRLPEPENKALHRAIGAAIGELLSRRADELGILAGGLGRASNLKGRTL